MPMNKLKDKDFKRLKSFLITDLLDENTPPERILYLSNELLATTGNKRNRKKYVSK